MSSPKLAAVNSRHPSPPEHLSDARKAIWADVVQAFDPPTDALAVLELYCVSLDRAEEARKVLDVEGLTYIDRFDKPKEHPLVAVEHNATLRACRCWRDLNLEADVAPASPLSLRRRAR